MATAHHLHHHLKHAAHAVRHGKHGKLLPIAAAVGVGALLLLMGHSSHAATNPPGPGPGPTPPQPPTPPLPNVRPKRTPNPPADMKYWATVSPVCGPNDAPGCRNGLLVHTAASSSSPLVGPEDVSATSSHLVTGDQAAVVRDDIPDPTGNGRIWAEIVTPTNVRGFVSFHGPNDPAGTSNFTNVQPVSPDDRPTPVVTSGYGYGFSHQYAPNYPTVGAISSPHGWPSLFDPSGYSPSFGPQVMQGRRWARCVAPSGCMLGDMHGRPTGVVVEHGGMVQVLSRTSDGRAVLVRYHDKLHGRPVDGYLQEGHLR